MYNVHQKSRIILKSRFLGVLVLVAVALISAACSSSDKKDSDSLKSSQYCERYREFESKVATAKPKEQLKLIKKILEAKDFPSTPTTLRTDYETVISEFEKALDGQEVLSNEEANKEAAIRINRHAVDNCATLES